jgi:hypothetical protein
MPGCRGGQRVGCDFGHGRSEQAKAGLGLAGPKDRRRRHADDVSPTSRTNKPFSKQRFWTSGSFEVCSMAQHLACPGDA